MELETRQPRTARWTHLVVILAVCAGVRIWLVADAEIIARDGTIYVQMARDWSQSGWDGIKGQTYHPGYPVSVSWMYAAMNALFQVDGRAGWEFSGQLVSLISNLLTVAGVWCFAGMVFNWRVAFVTALLFGLGRKFAALGADVLSDSLALCFQIWAAVLAVKVSALLDSRSRKAVLSAGLIGLLGGAAYLVRVEGLVIVVVSGLLWLRVRRNWTLRAASIVVMLLVCLACMSPYMLAVGGLTAKKSFSDFVIIPSYDLSVVASITGGATSSSAVLKFVGQLSEAMNPVLFFAAVIWLVDAVVRRPRRSPKSATPGAPRYAGVFIMVGTVGLLAPALIGQYYKHGFMSHRYLMFPAILISPWAGAGVLLVARYIGIFIPKAVKLQPLLIEGCVIAVFAVCILGNTVKKPLHSGKGYLRQAGLDLAKIAGDQEKVFFDSGWILHYAQRRGVLLDSDRRSFTEIVQQVSAHAASSKCYLVLSEAALADGFAEITSTRPALRIELIKRVVQQGKSDRSHSVWIYAVGP
ncbi:MAG: glycosyltransferase family 39 protein [Phycisphaerae bacterium]|jgi:hypothetical protein|nr:glycosyltransferase family 39 protein [Phycisphaerae bacterium]